MRRLADAQRALRDAIVAGNSSTVMPMLVAQGGRDPTYRLSIHQRHYEASLVDLVEKRFPALRWLVGAAFLRAAALDFARQWPPRAPALGAYGQGFPAYIAARPGTEAMPWLAEVGALEWSLAEVAAEVTEPPLTVDALVAFEAVPLEALHFRLQPGLAYAAFAWPVDELVRLHLDGNPPEALRFEAGRVALEIHGARGTFAMRRLSEPDFALRRALAADAPVAAGLAAAESVGDAFDAGGAVAALFSEGLVAGIHAAEAAA